MKNPIKALLHYALCGIFLVSQTAVIADEFSDAAKNGQDDGKAAAAAFNSKAPTMSGSTITMGDGSTLDTSQLFPGTSGAKPMSDFFPDGVAPDIEALKTAGGDGDTLKSTGEGSQSGLFNDASKSSGSTVTGQAYDTVMKSKLLSRPDLRNDPVFNKTKDTFANMDTIAKSFSDCSTATNIVDAPKNGHISDIKVCQRAINPDIACKVDHNFKVEVLTAAGAVYNKDYTISIPIGNANDNSLNGGNCGKFNLNTTITVHNIAAIKKVYLKKVVWDDYGNISLNGTRIWGEDLPTVDYGSFSVSALDKLRWKSVPKKCDLKKSKSDTPGTDVTEAFLSEAKKTGSVNFTMSLIVGDKGEGLAEIIVEYDPHLAIVADEWVPPECLAAAQVSDEKYATITSACSSINTGAANTGCQLYNGVWICNKDFNASPIAGIPALCQQVSVDVKYHLESVSEAIKGDTCDVLEKNPKCSFISSKCTDEDPLRKGFCAFYDEKWDCGEDVVIPDIKTETSYSCVGPVRCMGTDCITPEKTESQSFTETLAMTNAAGFMSQDMNCDATGANCKVFAGEHLECKIAIGGAQDCCDVPTSLSAADYITSLYQVYKLNSAIMTLESGNAVVGAYQTIGNAVGNTVSTVTKPFASYIENISGAGESFFKPVTAFVDELKQTIKDKLAETINKMFADTATDMGANAAASQAGNEALKEEGVTEGTKSVGESVVGNVGAAMGALMMAYTIYVVAMMIIQAIYKCEDEEFALATKKSTKSCQYVGSYCKDSLCLEKRRSYCCYASPLARIIDSQYHNQANKQYGSPKNPDCGGIPLTDIANVDWSKIDLTEWTSMLSEYNLLPDTKNITMESLTGDGSNLNMGAGRLDAAERTLKRMDGMDITGINYEARDNSTVNPKGVASSSSSSSGP